MVTLALIQGVVNTFVMFFTRIIGNIVDRAFSRMKMARYWLCQALVAELVLGI